VSFLRNPCESGDAEKFGQVARISAFGRDLGSAYSVGSDVTVNTIRRTGTALARVFQAVHPSM
jgi:hypothetical protein